MEWIESWAGKAENILNFVDQAAGQALQTDLAEPKPISREWDSQQVTSAVDRTMYIPQYVSPQQIYDINPDRPKSVPYQNILNNSESAPASLSRWNSDRLGGYTEPIPSAFVQPSPPVMFKSVGNSLDRAAHSSPTKNTRPNSKDKDAELFEFLNAPDVVSTSSSKVTPSRIMDSMAWSSKSYLPVSASGSVNDVTTTAMDAHKNSIPRISSVNASSNQWPGTELMSRSDRDADSNHESTSNTEPRHALTREISVMEQENSMLKNEVASLNQELSSIIQRGNGMHEELLEVRQKLADKGQSVQLTRELQARLQDMQEAMKSKDTQLAVLRVRLEEADRDLDGKRRTANQLQAHANGMLQDQQTTDYFSSSTVEALRVKLAETESELEHERTAHKALQEESMEKLNGLEVDKQRLCSEVGQAQRQIHDEKARSAELAAQQKISKSISDAAKQELTEYKDKAMRILQSKERLIASLRDGSAGSQTSSETLVSASELDGVRQERDMLREELHQTRLALETAKLEVAELESQIEREQSSIDDQTKILDERLTEERNRRSDLEQDSAKLKQELTKCRTEMTNQVSALQSRLDDRESEINRLRNQLTTKSLSANSQEELEGRLHMLTESLIQKQTMLETLSTEKNSLTLQLERMERQYREAEASAMRASASSVDVSDQHDARHRLSGFLGESPSDGNVARQVKTAANSIDRFSIRLGLFLRRYPAARVFIILYMLLLHVWVMIVIMTYNQEVHSSDHAPKPPASQ